MNATILESGMKGFEYFVLVFKRLSVDSYEYNLRRNGYTVANYVQKFPSIVCLADAANRMYNALLLDYMISLATGVYYLYESCDKDGTHPRVLTVGLLPLMYVDHADINSVVTKYLEMALSPETAFSNDWRIV